MEQLTVAIKTLSDAFAVAKFAEAGGKSVEVTLGGNNVPSIVIEDSSEVESKILKALQENNNRIINAFRQAISKIPKSSAANTDLLKFQSTG
jgi:uncharacterized protein YjfI (DUF2170 family)